MSARTRATLVVVLAFVLGVAVGSLGLGIYVARTGGRLPFASPARFQASMLHRLTRELDLRPEQRERVEAALKETGGEFARLREEMRPRFQEIRNRSRERIRTILDGEQQAKFDALSAEWERRADRWRRP
jgi:hypothetical protein